MNNGPEQPDNLPERQPDRERLPDYEIDLTGAIDQTGALIDVIGDAIVEAGRSGEVPEWGARAMARYLANKQRENGTALHHFAATGRMDFERIGLELADLWREQALPRLTVEAINRLGTYLIAEHRKAEQAATPSYLPATQERIHELGPAYAAFLRLPDVTEATDIETFHDAFVGSYDSLDALIADTVETLELRQLLEEAVLDHIASIDPVKVLRMVRDCWDLVHLDGRYYLFDK
jgi:hypothetical protein